MEILRDALPLKHYFNISSFSRIQYYELRTRDAKQKKP